MKMDTSLGEVDWGALLGKVVEAVPNVASSVYTYKTAVEQAKANANNPLLNMGTDTGYLYNPNYSGYFGTGSGLPGQTDYTPFIIGGIVLVGALFLMRSK